MEKEESGAEAVGDYWWWAAASTAQLGWGISVVRRGYSGDTYNMPFKAAGVATLFVGAFASAFVATLRASGIHSVSFRIVLDSDVFLNFEYGKKCRVLYIIKTPFVAELKSFCFSELF